MIKASIYDINLNYSWFSFPYYLEEAPWGYLYNTQLRELSLQIIQSSLQRGKDYNAKAVED